MGALYSLFSPISNRYFVLATERFSKTQIVASEPGLHIVC